MTKWVDLYDQSQGYKIVAAFATATGYIIFTEEHVFEIDGSNNVTETEFTLP